MSEELTRLRELLRARQNRPGYADNVKAILARIAELEAAE